MNENYDVIRATIQELGAPAISLRKSRGDREELPFVSCLGGVPMLPANVAPPRHIETGQLLAFVGQVNFGDISKQLADEFNLPTSGLLQLFHLWQDGWIEEYGEVNHAVVWHPDPTIIDWRAAEDVPSISPEQLPLIGERGASWVSRDRLAEMNTFTESALNDFYRQDGPYHQLAGSPKIVQFDPVAELNRTPSQSLLARLRNRPLPSSPKWRLLWQIDSDKRVDLNWVDGGAFYLLVSEEALKARDFRQLAGILHSY